MTQNLRRLAHRALQEAPGRGESTLSVYDWAVSRILGAQPGLSEAEVRRAIDDLRGLPGSLEHYGISRRNLTVPVRDLKASTAPTSLRSHHGRSPRLPKRSGDG